LIFIGAGEGRFVRDGVQQGCAREEIILVRPGERHQFLAGESDILEQLYLGFSFDFDVPENEGRGTPILLPSGPLADVLKSELRASLDRLKRNSGHDALAAVRGHLLAVISRVNGHVTAPEADAVPEDAKGSLARLAREFLHANLSGKITVPAMARNFCLSPQYFGEVFKRETGLSVKEYQRNLRMDRAMELLRNTGLSITEVAEEVGLEDLAYFSRLFKLRFGIPPRQARTGSAA
jgi:AraC-like DNA-binding protein